MSLSKLDTLPQTLDLQLLTHGPPVNISHIIRRGLEMARGIIALGDEDAVLGAIAGGLVQGDGRAHELLLDTAEAVEARLQLEVVVGGGLGDGADDGDVVAAGTDVVGGADHGDVDVVLAADLGLGEDELQRVRVGGAVDGVVEDADALEQVAGDAGLAGEVGGVAEDHLGLGLELHGGVVGAGAALLHGGFDARDTAVGARGDFVDRGVEHVGAAVDGRQAGKALGQFAEAVEGVDVGGLAVAGHGVGVEADALDGLFGLAGVVDVLVGLVEGHGVADEVAGGGLEAELVIDLLHGALVEVEACDVLAWTGHVVACPPSAYPGVNLGCSRRRSPPTPKTSWPSSSRTDPSTDCSGPRWPCSGPWPRWLWCLRPAGRNCRQSVGTRGSG